jgi:hypothetical membrane protein
MPASPKAIAAGGANGTMPSVAWRGRRLGAAAAAGLAGPAFFIADWAILGTRAHGYSPVHDAISELARMHAPTRLAMTAGFVVLGTALPIYSQAVREALPGSAWKFVLTHGIATLGVAAFPLGTTTSGNIHGAFAAVAYASLAAVPIAAGVALRRAARPELARTSTATGAVCAAALLASVIGPAHGHGLLQRIGLTTGDVWLMTSAAALLWSTATTVSNPSADPAG